MRRAIIRGSIILCRVHREQRDYLANEKDQQVGLIDFVKDAGERILAQAGQFWGRDANAASQASSELEKTIAGMGLSIENLSVQLDDEVATVTGKASTQADRERAILVVGNTQGVAKVDDQITVDAPEPEASYYTVQSGDSLSKIAKQFYGDASKYPVIFEANRPMLKDPDKIYPGQNLRIPPAS